MLREQKGEKFSPTFPDCRFFGIEVVNVASLHGFLSFPDPKFLFLVNDTTVSYEMIQLYMCQIAGSKKVIDLCKSGDSHNPTYKIVIIKIVAFYVILELLY